MSRRSRVLFAFIILVLTSLACNLTGDAAPANDGQQVSADAPTVEVRVPVNGMSFADGTTVVVQVVGTDAGSGVSQITLEIDGLPAGTTTAPNPAGQSALIANFEWAAQGVGAHSIAAIATRADGTASLPATISVNVVEAQPTPVPPTDIPPTDVPPTEAPPEEEEPTEVPPEPTPSGPIGTSTTGMNVRNGPSTLYPVIGSVLAGTDLELNGRNSDGSWYRASYGLSNGWFFGGLLTTSGDVAGLPVISVAPPPATATPIPPTAVPQPTSPPQPAEPRFWSTVGDGQTYPPGTCFRFYWEASGIREIYFDGTAATGVNTPENGGGTERCPSGTGTFTYTLRVIFTDGSQRDYSISATVN